MRCGSLVVTGMEIGAVMEGAGAGISSHFLGCFLHYYGLVINIFSNQLRQCVRLELLHLPACLGGDLC